MSDEQKASRHSAASDKAYPDIPDSEDFDRYGVWVKAGPEDVEEGEQEEVELGLDDLSEEEFEPSGAETMLTDEEEDALADLESEQGGAEDGGETEFALDDFESLEADEDSGQAAETEMSLELDGETLSIDTGSAEQEEPAAGEAAPAETAGLEDLEESVSEDILDVDIDLDEDIDAELEDLALDLGEETPSEAESGLEGPGEPAAEAAASADESSSGDSEDIEELSLDDLDTLDLDAETGSEQGSVEPAQAEPTDEAEELDLESIPGEDAFADFDFEEEEEESTEELPELSGDEEEEETPLPSVEDDEDTIDAELASVLDEEEHSSGGEFDTADFESAQDFSETEDVMSTAGTSTGGGRDESSVLVNIEKELLAIKNELNELKQELSTLRAGGARPSTGEESGEDMEVSLGTPSGERGGFFEQEEEEDETIALTGDELDHILDTAELTEQPGQPTEYDDLDLRLDDSLSPGADTATAQEPEGSPIEEITLEDMAGDSALEELESEEGSKEPESDELEELDLDLGSEEEPTTPEAPAGEDGGEDLSVEFDELTHGGGGEGNVDALADMDVDSELAGIEELADEPGRESRPDTSDIDSIEIELPGDEEEGESGFAGADTDVEEFDASLGEPVLEIPDEEDSEPEELDSLELEEEEEPAPEPAPAPSGQAPAPASSGQASGTGSEAAALPENLKQEIRSVLSYMDQLLESLPEEKIQEFAKSEHFEVYKRLFEELGLENE